MLNWSRSWGIHRQVLAIIAANAAFVSTAYYTHSLIAERSYYSVSPSLYVGTLLAYLLGIGLLYAGSENIGDERSIAGVAVVSFTLILGPIFVGFVIPRVFMALSVWYVSMGAAVVAVGLTRVDKPVKLIVRVWQRE